MASLQFDITCDNTNFINSIKQVQESIKKANEALNMSSSAGGIDFSDAERGLAAFDKSAARFCENIAKRFDDLTKKAEEFKKVLEEGGNALKSAEANSKELSETKAQLEMALDLIKKLQDENEKIKGQFVDLGNAIKDSDVEALRRFREMAGGTFEELKAKAEELKQGILIDESVLAVNARKIQNLKNERQQWSYMKFEANSEYRNTGDQSAFDDAIYAANQISAIDDQIKQLEESSRIVREHMAAAREELGGVVDATKESANAMGEAEQKALSVQQRLAEAKQKMQDLVDAGKGGTKEFQDIAKEAAKLKDEIEYTEKVIEYYQDTSKIFGKIKTGVQAVEDATTLASDALGLFGIKSKEVEAIQEKVAQVTKVLTQLESMYALVKKGSTLQLVFEEVKTWALVKARGAQTVATTAATAAQNSLNAAMARNPIGAVLTLLVLLGTAIYGVVSALKSASKEEEEATNVSKEHAEALKQLKEAHEKEMREWRDSVAQSAGSQIASYKKLQRQWNELGDNLKAKEKFIHDNAGAFQSLGFSVNSVTAAENFFVNNTAAVVAAITARARAAAYEEAIKKSTARQIELQETHSIGTGDYRYVFKAGQSYNQDYYDEKFGKGTVDLGRKDFLEKIGGKGGTQAGFGANLNARYGNGSTNTNTSSKGSYWDYVYVDKNGKQRLTQKGADLLNEYAKRDAYKKRVERQIEIEQEDRKQQAYAEASAEELNSIAKILKGTGITEYSPSSSNLPL